MRRRRTVSSDCGLARAALVLLFATARCGGGGPAPASYAMSVPFAVPLASCPARNALGSMQAVLEIGGQQDPCALSVHPTTLAATGECPDIFAHTVRPLGLRYSLPNPTATDELAALAYIIGWVDLRDDHLDAAATEVPVHLVPDGVGAVLLTTNDDVAALPAEQTSRENPIPPSCASISEDAQLQLCLAKNWAGLHFRPSDLPIDFDRDLDLVRNIVEACDGTLF